MTWRAAMEHALYGEHGFYRRGEPPGAHFRTSVHASTRYAAALAGLLAEVDAALGHPDRLDVVDMGAGRGEFLTQIMDAAGPALTDRLAPVAVELAPCPPGLSKAVTWCTRPPTEITGMVIANEWLDNIPLDVVELTPTGPRVVLVDMATGEETPGPSPSPEFDEWLVRWWPLREPGDRAEIGSPRCGSWAATVRSLRRGLALAIDYGHSLAERPVYGTLAGYRDGHCVPPVPDGSCDITAHVALDACAAAGQAAGATSTLLTTQRSALRSLGLSGSRPPVELAHRDPRAYVTALCAAGEDAELTEPGGLGGFGWLAQTIGIDLPRSLRRHRT